MISTKLHGGLTLELNAHLFDDDLDVLLDRCPRALVPLLFERVEPSFLKGVPTHDMPGLVCRLLRFGTAVHAAFGKEETKYIDAGTEGQNRTARHLLLMFRPTARLTD